MPDVDLPKAEHVLSVLRQARLSRNETAATMIAELVYEMAYTDLREPEIEGARKAAWIEISALAAPQSGIVRTARYVERRPQSHGKVEKVVGLGSWRCCGLFPLFQYAKAIDDGAV